MQLRLNLDADEISRLYSIYKELKRPNCDRIAAYSLDDMEYFTNDYEVICVDLDPVSGNRIDNYGVVINRRQNEIIYYVEQHK